MKILRAATVVLIAFLIASATDCTYADGLHGTMGTYDSPPRNKIGRVDIPVLLQQLGEIHANTYSFSIWNNTNDWADLLAFLPEAQKAGVAVWASIVPPSESPPRSHHYSEPFRLDYEKWAEEFAQLSLAHTNLIAWSIDDFTLGTKKFFTTNRVKRILTRARAINPRLAFVPCCYYRGITADFLKNYRPLLDGILFPYRHESGGANLKDWDLVASEVQRIKSMTGPDFPIIVDVYATGHSSLGRSTLQYVGEVMTAGHNSADGVLIYCHQDPVRDRDKYQIIKKLFTSWSPSSVRP